MAEFKFGLIRLNGDSSQYFLQIRCSNKYQLIYQLTVIQFISTRMKGVNLSMMDLKSEVLF